MDGEMVLEVAVTPPVLATEVVPTDPVPLTVAAELLGDKVMVEYKVVGTQVVIAMTEVELEYEAEATSPRAARAVATSANETFILTGGWCGKSDLNEKRLVVDARVKVSVLKRW